MRMGWRLRLALFSSSFQSYQKDPWYEAIGESECLQKGAVKATSILVVNACN